MRNFKAAYINELCKLSKRKKVTVAVILCLCVIAIGAVLTCTVRNFMGINIAGESEFALMMLPVFVNIIIPLFIIFICIDMFCSEYSANTIKTTLLVPATRLKVFSAKLSAALTFIAAMLGFVMLISIIVSIPIRHTEFAYLKVFFSYLLCMFPLAVVCIMAALISNIARGSGSAFMFSLVVFLAVKALELLNPTYAAFFFTNGLNMYVLLNAPLFVFSKLLRLILIAIGYCAMFFAAGFAIFDNREI